MDVEIKVMEGNFVGRDISVCEGGEILNLNGQIDGYLDPVVGMEFESEEAAMMYYDAYAKRLGFIVRLGNCHRAHDGSVISRKFLCNKEGFRVSNKKKKVLEVRKPREATREGCKAMMMVRKENAGKWVVTKVETSHTHALGVSTGKGRRGMIQDRPQDEKDRIIRELSTQLNRANQQLAGYRKQMDLIIEYIEQHTIQLSKNVENVLQNIKEIEAQDRSE